MNKTGKELIEPKSKGLAAFIRGVKESTSDEHRESAYRLVKGFLSNNLVEKAFEEIDRYIKSGRIEESALEDLIVQSTFLELLKFIDEEVPDEVRIRAMKSIFLSSVVNEASEEDQKLAYMLIKLTKNLDSTDILIIKSAYEIWHNQKEIDPKSITNARSWHEQIAKKIGHNIPQLIANQESELVNLNIFIGGPVPDQSGSGKMRTNTYQLTKLGEILYEFITNFENGIK